MSQIAFRLYLSEHQAPNELRRFGGAHCAQLRQPADRSRVCSGTYAFPVAVLVGLYEEPERPPNAVDYVKRYMGAPTGVDVEALRAENDTLKKENLELKDTIEELNARVINAPRYAESPNLTVSVLFHSGSKAKAKTLKSSVRRIDGRCNPLFALDLAAP